MELDKELYNEIKVYCELNNLKTRDYIHNILKKAFLEDKYGKMPAIFKKKEINKANEEFVEIINNVGGVDNFNDMVNECIFDTKEKEVKAEKEIKVESEPEKKVVKVIKRKLNE